MNYEYFYEYFMNTFMNTFLREMNTMYTLSVNIPFFIKINRLYTTILLIIIDRRECVCIVIKYSLYSLTDMKYSWKYSLTIHLTIHFLEIVE